MKSTWSGKQIDSLLMKLLYSLGENKKLQFETFLSIVLIITTDGISYMPISRFDQKDKNPTVSHDWDPSHTATSCWGFRFCDLRLWANAWTTRHDVCEYLHSPIRWPSLFGPLLWSSESFLTNHHIHWRRNLDCSSHNPVDYSAQNGCSLARPCRARFSHNG